MSAEGKKEITVAGLSRYRIYEDGDSFKIWSKKSKREMKPKCSYRRKDFTGTRWNVIDDSGKDRNISEGHIRFLLRHNELSLEMIPATNKVNIYVTKDGRIEDKSEMRKNSTVPNVFDSLEDVLETVLTLIRIRDTGELCYPVIADREEIAVRLVTRWTHEPVSFVRDCVDEASEKFERKCRTMRVQRIMPLFALFTMCLKFTVIERKRNRLELQDGFRRYEDIEANP